MGRQDVTYGGLLQERRRELHARIVGAIETLHGGKREQAGQHLTSATMMYREMDMGFWLTQAEAEVRRS